LYAHKYTTHANVHSQQHGTLALSAKDINSQIMSSKHYGEQALTSECALSIQELLEDDLSALSLKEMKPAHSLAMFAFRYPHCTLKMFDLISIM